MQKEFPNKPGVYLFKNEKDEIIYVGKAKNLKKRVSSYFSKSNQSPKTSVLVKNIGSYDYIIVNNEVEALLLENKLIKEHSPKYNIDLKDDKTYAYIKVTEEKFPRIISSRRVTKKGKYFGPYTDGYKRIVLVDALNKHFKLCTKNCMNSKSKLSYDIGLCNGACIGKETSAEYKERVKEAIKILKGNIKDLKKISEKKLEEYIKTQKYELAKIEKEILDSLELILQKQHVDEIKNINQDVIAMTKTKTHTHFSILHINKGTILGKENFKLDEVLFSKFLANYYYAKQVPHEIIVSEKLDEKERSILEKYLESFSKRKVTITYPLRGDKKELLKLAKKNINSSEEEILKLTKEKLGLNKIPRTIECFDISNLKDEFIVAGMTRFEDGKPNKQGYRRFKIKSKQTQDDFKGIHEVVFRRYYKLKEQPKQLPDLVIIDGGLGQLQAAKKALKELNLELEIISIAKREEEIYKSKDEIIKLNKNKQPILFIRKIRDETHRFAINYNKKLRAMNLRDSFNKTK